MFTLLAAQALKVARQVSGQYLLFSYGSVKP